MYPESAFSISQMELQAVARAVSTCTVKRCAARQRNMDRLGPERGAATLLPRPLRAPGSGRLLLSHSEPSPQGSGLLHLLHNNFCVGGRSRPLAQDPGWQPGPLKRHTVVLASVARGSARRQGQLLERELQAQGEQARDRWHGKPGGCWLLGSPAWWALLWTGAHGVEERPAFLEARSQRPRTHRLLCAKGSKGDRADPQDWSRTPAC